MDVVIEGRAWFNGHLEQCCIGIMDGRIAAIKKNLEGDRRFDFNDKIILPGAIDVHVHFRDPGYPGKEDFGTGSMAAAFGGVTCVFDMPNTNPATISLENLMAKKAIASDRSWVDFGLFAGVTPTNDLIPMAKESIGFKMFMGSSTHSIIMTEDADIERTLSSVARTGKVISVHAEDERLIKRDPEHALADHATNRPPRAEQNAIERLLKYAGSAKVNICHVSSIEGLNSLAKTSFTKEITVHHMLLDAGSDLKTFGKVNPPLRSRAERELLLDAFIKGKFDMLASDHAPHSLEDKHQEFGSAPSGVPGVETTVPMMLALVRKGKLDLGTLMRCCAQRPADIFGLRKGRIAIGNDADLMVIDSRPAERIVSEKLHSRCGWTPFEGREALFPHSVFLRGEELINEGSIVGERKGRDVVAAINLPSRPQ